MKGKQLLAALSLVIKENMGNDERLIALMRSMPQYLETLKGDFEAFEKEIEELKKENESLLLEFDKQKRFDFMQTTSHSPQEAMFSVVGE